MRMGKLYRKTYGNTHIPKSKTLEYKEYDRRNELLNKSLSRVYEKNPLSRKELKEFIRLRKKFPLSESEKESLIKAHYNRNYGFLGVTF